MNVKDPFDPNVNVVVPNHSRVVILRPLSDPDDGACLHGQVNCMRCDQWCALGSETYQLVVSGEAGPICLHCAQETARRVGRFGSFRGSVRDHREA